MTISAEADGKGGRRWRAPEALPTLGPVAMRIYVAIWSVLLAAAIAVSAVSVYFGMEPHRNPTWSAIGLNVGDGPREPVIIEVAGYEPRARGVKPGDVVLAVDGRPGLSGTGAARAMDAWVLGADGTTRRLTIRTGTDAPREVVLTRNSEEREQRWRAAGITSFAFYALSSALAFIGKMLLMASAVLLFRQRRQPVAALLSFAFLAIPAGSLPNEWSNLAALGQVSTALGWTALLLAMMAMPDGRFSARWTRWLASALLLYSGSGFILEPLGLGWIMPTWLGLVLTVGFVIGAVAAMGVRYRGLAQGPERQQLRWAFLGFATGAVLIVASVALDLIAPALAHLDERWPIWRQLGTSLFFTLAISAFALGLLVSLLRYRLYDADAVIGRSAGYAVLTLMLAAAFGVSAKLIEVFFETSFASDAGALPGAVGAGLVLTLIAPMHRRIHDWAERRFQKNILRLRRDLPRAVDDLRETASLDELLGETLARVMRGTRATRAAVIIDGRLAARLGQDGEDWAMEVPLKIAHQDLVIGTLLVGPRPDGSQVGKDERSALAEIADPVARAIRIVRTREAHFARVEADAARHEKRLAALEARLNLAAAS